MFGQRNLVDGVRRFQPSSENWLAKPAAEIPDRLSVDFVSGQTGTLDMKSPLGIHWAGVLDRLAKAGDPVYVEIDEESNMICNVFIPEVFTVKAIHTDDNRNLVVELSPSAAGHFLLKSNPDFEALRDTLQGALDSGAPLLITETEAENEIIDTRPPTLPSGGPPDPPDDPPVSEARVHEIFGLMRAETCSCNPSSN